MGAFPFAVAAAVLAATPAMAGPGDAAALAVAQCVVDNDPEGVAELLGTLPGSPLEERAAKPLLELYGPCKDNDESASGYMQWRERAELAYAAARERLAQGRPAQVTATWAPPSTAGMIAGRHYDLRSVDMLTYGACIARAAPDASIGLVGSAPRSAEERAAVQALKPVIGSCFRQGQVFRLEIADLRFIVAEPVYHIIGAGPAGAR